MLVSLQRRLIYKPECNSLLQVALYPELLQYYPAARDVCIPTPDNESLGAWYLPFDNSQAVNSSRLIIFLHGNAGNRSGRLGWYKLFYEFGVSLLAIDYRGYGDSTGTPSEEGLARDAIAAWHFAKSLGYTDDSICLTGVSLGGAVAVRLASTLSSTGSTPAGLVLVATFASMVETAAFHYPWVPVRWLLRDRFDSASFIKTIDTPILCFHGNTDDIVPIEMGKRLMSFAPDKSRTGIRPRFVEMKGVAHRRLAESGIEFYRRHLPVFLRQIWNQQTPPEIKKERGS
ncbi:MAG: alpha/beta hydrolase [Planctomycetaceae bacterium]